MALGCHWPSMALIGADASRFAVHLGCGDDGLDVGDDGAHEEATHGRDQAGFERNSDKEVVSDECALIKEVPFERVEGRWEVIRAPLKVRVLSGEGDPEVGVPRFLADFDALREECRRSGTPEDVEDRAKAFLLERYGRPLRRLASWGLGVPGYPNGWRDPWLSRPSPTGAGGPPLSRPGTGGSEATHGLLARSLRRWESPWAGSSLDPMVPLGREDAGPELTWEVFSSLDVVPGDSPGPESLPELMARLSAAMAPPFLQRNEGEEESEFPRGGWHPLGPRVVGVGGDFPVASARRPLPAKRFRRQRGREWAS